MKKILSILVVVFCVSVHAQWTQWGLGLIQKPNAQSARIYMGVSNVVAGSNIVIFAGPLGTLVVNSTASGGGGSGTNGVNGTNATVSVGSTTTLAPGSPATVTNSGTSLYAILDFGIPTGATGAAGASGTNGTNATFSLTNTITLPAGSPATVSNLGTISDAILQFSIPQGATGVTGATGPQGPSGTGLDSSLTNVTAYANGTNFLLDFSIPSQTFYSTGDINFVYSTNWPGADVSRFVSCVIPATNYYRQILFPSGWTTAFYNPFGVPAFHPAKILFQSLGSGETNVVATVFISSSKTAGLTNNIDTNGIPVFGWWDADVGVYQTPFFTSPCYDGAVVRGWTDISGYGLSVTNGGNTVNKMSLYWKGVNSSPKQIPSLFFAKDTVAYQTTLASTNFTGVSQPLWCFIVYYSDRGGNAVMDNGNVNSRCMFAPAMGGYGSMAMYCGNSLSLIGPTPVKWTLFSFFANAGSSTIRTNGIQGAAGPTSTGAPTRFNIGSDNSGASPSTDFYVSEIMFVKSNMTGLQVTNVENYLMQKYGTLK